MASIMTKQSLFACLFAAFAGVAHAQSALPPKMEGRWNNPASGHSNKVEVELVRMENPSEAVIRIAWWPYCQVAETRAEFIDGAWKFSPQNCANRHGPMTITARVKPVEGKNRLEGYYGSREEPLKTVYLEWE